MQEKLSSLTWVELARASGDPSRPASVRLTADRLLAGRLPELELGERVALARRASRSLLSVVVQDAEPGVLRAAVSNPRMTELVLSRVLTRDDLPAEFLGWLATESAFGERRAVCLAILRNPRTPKASALRLMKRLERADLDALRHAPTMPRLLRIAADRLLGEAAVDRPTGPHFG